MKKQEKIDYHKQQIEKLEDKARQLTIKKINKDPTYNWFDMELIANCIDFHTKKMCRLIYGKRYLRTK